METRPPSIGGLAAVAGFALSCFGLLIYLWSTFGGPTPLAPQGYRFTALYPDASQLIAQTDVRISGVDVGRVTEVTQEGEMARAEIELDPDEAPLPADTQTVLRRKTLLGEPFIELIPGTPEDEGGELLAEGDELPVGQTQRAVDLDEVLRALDRKTRADVKLILEELAKATEGSGEAFNSALANMQPATESGARLFDVLASQRAAVRGLVRDSGTVLGALSERRGALAGLVEASDRVLATTAARDAELTETVKLLPPLLDELDPTLETARRLGVAADPLLDELSPAVDDLAPTLTDLRALAPDLEGAFTDLQPALAAAPRGVPALVDTLDALGPLLREARPALRDAIPAVQWLIPYQREISAWFTKLGLATQSSYGEQGHHILRVVIPFTQEGLNIWSGQPLFTNRHNAYSKPGYLEDVGRPHLRAIDCRNATLPAHISAPPCEEQGPFSFNGFEGTVPQVHRAP